MIEETIEMETPEVVDKFDEEIVPVEDEGSILPAIGFGATVLGGGIAIIAACKHFHVLGRAKSAIDAGVNAFKNFEMPEEESTEVEASDVEVKNVEDPAE